MGRMDDQDEMLEPDDSPTATRDAGLSDKPNWHPEKTSEEQEDELVSEDLEEDDPEQDD
jgi:hypothetical protein